MEKLIFVYNATSGWQNSVLDGLHKVVSPKTYACSLCAITFGAFTENKTWKKFREENGALDMEFLHKDEFVEKYKGISSFSLAYPVVLKSTKDELEPLLRAEELNKLKEAQELIDVLQEKLLN